MKRLQSARPLSSLATGLALCLVTGLALFDTSTQAAPLPDKDVPAPLQPWIGWVLQGQDPRACPLVGGSSDQRLCTWPSNLELNLDATGGRFEIEAQLFAPGWIDLPGDTEHWPQDLRVNGQALPVALHQGSPKLWLGAGRHRIQGEFHWPRLPESLYVPSDIGLLSLSIDGQRSEAPNRDDRGHVWLGKSTEGKDSTARHLDLKVFRLIDDDIPVRLITHIDLEAAGEVRDEVIGPVLPPGFIALQIGGSLPARLDDDGRLHVQVRPGVWNVEISARAPQPLSTLSAAKNAAPWPEQEVWSFLAHNDLRVVETGGAPAVDPRQTQMPEDWQDYPAFLLEAGGQLSLAEKQRGSPQTPADQLSLQRQLWLDFDGGGYSLQDHLSGQLNSRWRLEATAPLTPGRVQVDGEPQLITRLAEADAGVEVRHGELDLSADSRIDSATRQLPVTGWNTDLQSVETDLYLPPGWRLFATSGTDNLPDTWIGAWSLLDLFLVLVVSVAALRVFGRKWGLLTLLALALSWHEPGAPHWSWLNLIAVIALTRALPDSLKTAPLSRWLGRYRCISLAAVLLIAVPFAVQQLRASLYPQLELQAGGSYGLDRKLIPAPEMVMRDSPAPQAAAMTVPAPPQFEVPASGGAIEEDVVVTAQGRNPNVSQQSIQRMDPNVLTQTGPGLPEWTWRATTLSWSGPVAADQQFRLWLSPPWMTRLLQVLSVALIFGVLVGWMNLKIGFKPKGPSNAAAQLAGAALLVGLLIATLAPAIAQAQEAEPVAEPVAEPQPQAPRASAPDLLAELRQRLLAAPECAPNCAQIARLAIDVDNQGQIRLGLSIDALAPSSVPLPLPLLATGAQGRIWQPAQVLLDGQTAPLLRNAEGQLLLAVGSGRHEALIRGSLAGFDRVQLPLPLTPRLLRSELRGWLLSGVDERGGLADSLQLLRSQISERSENSEAQALPPLLIVTRTLHLGMDWDVETEVERQGVTHTPVLAAIPLLDGEQITGEAVRVSDRAVQLSLAPGQTSTRWTSRLPIGPQLQLRAPKTSDAVEIWAFDISPLWHVEFEGLPAIRHQDDGFWLPRYQPWSGEALQLKVSRPAGVKGQTLTLDSVGLTTAPAQRATDYELSFHLRASQGGQHPLTLPEGLKLQTLSIDSREQPARQEGGKLILPLHPGSQDFALHLRGDQTIGLRVATPALDLGLPGVNARLTIQLPPDRWVLLVGGPRLGPAVLFWGALAVLLGLAYALGRIKLAPLKFWHWALLMIGLSQIPIWAAAVVAFWPIALGLRGRVGEGLPARRFNLMQLGLAALTLFALGLLFSAVAKGLLGAPDMQIAGNDSAHDALRWFQDRWQTQLPTAWVISLPLWVYRVVMLLWALWLANALLGWLRWGWTQFTAQGLWQRPPPKPATNKPAEPTSVPSATEETPKP